MRVPLIAIVLSSILGFVLEPEIAHKAAYSFSNCGINHENRGEAKSAVSAYSMAIFLDGDAYAYAGRATALIGVFPRTVQNLKQSIRDFDRAIAMDPDGTTYLNRACPKNLLGDWRGAVADYTEAIRFNPNDLVAYCCRGHVKEENGDRAGAIQDYSQVLKRAGVFEWTLTPNHENARKYMLRPAPVPYLHFPKQCNYNALH